MRSLSIQTQGSGDALFIQDHCCCISLRIQSALKSVEIYNVELKKADKIILIVDRVMSIGEGNVVKNICS